MVNYSAIVAAYCEEQAKDREMLESQIKSLRDEMMKALYWCEMCKREMRAWDWFFLKFETETWTAEIYMGWVRKEKLLREQITQRQHLMEQLNREESMFIESICVATIPDYRSLREIAEQAVEIGNISQEINNIGGGCGCSVRPRGRGITRILAKIRNEVPKLQAMCAAQEIAFSLPQGFAVSAFVDGGISRNEGDRIISQLLTAVKEVQKDCTKKMRDSQRYFLQEGE